MANIHPALGANLGFEATVNLTVARPVFVAWVPWGTSLSNEAKASTNVQQNIFQNWSTCLALGCLPRWNFEVDEQCLPHHHLLACFWHGLVSQLALYQNQPVIIMVSPSLTICNKPLCDSVIFHFKAEALYEQSIPWYAYSESGSCKLTGARASAS